ncbi:hypothetical protein HNP38_003336 [Chryseobacterium defluvii]|uniref:Lipoprotein n=1 Tax=Chryseobacterium defluvii TaxID=160396 RepID=A0A840KFN1_9FLAO|nr:hypothetical protein [Chryseobacterium defluvii]MBB4807996.1 hypothetical protein [Chryseobacterium defluvii]
MKKILFILTACLLALQSCSVNSEITYHKDSASTTVMDLDMKDAMEMMKSMVPDSAKNGKKDFTELEKLPKTWTSLYELEKKEGKLKTDHPDSIRIMKKIFMKSNVENNEIMGISMKMDHFTMADYQIIGSSSKKDKLPLDQMALNSWDGKTLTIETENLNLNGFKDVLGGKDFAGEDDESPEEDSEKSTGMMKMMYKKIGTTLKFENKIKSITGKHDWVTKVDDYSVRIDYDLDTLFGDSEKPLKHSDKKIIIVTE